MYDREVMLKNCMNIMHCTMQLKKHSQPTQKSLTTYI